MSVEERLDRIERMLVSLVHQQQARQWYCVEEFARIVGRSEFTCREWCRKGRIAAIKKGSGRGAHFAWAIPHEELLRYQREGLRHRGKVPSRLEDIHFETGQDDTSVRHGQSQATT
jgi:hypothetical protein